MPTNVTAEYRKAEQAYRQARQARERLDCLKAMLRSLPKHKGTEHLQADIKGRIKQLTDELSGPRRGGARSAALHTVRPEGAAQICLIGAPNCGKSALHARLTGSQTQIGPYPHTTHSPVPGMLAYQDIHFQLVDLPPVDGRFMESWLVGAIKPADAALLVVDLGDPACLDQVIAIREQLQARRLILDERWPGLDPGEEARPSGIDGDEPAWPDPFLVRLPTLLLANKADLDPGPDEVRVLEELAGVRYPALATSARTGQGLDRLGAMLFRGLGIVRVYTKAPGRPADRDRPFTVRRGDTVLDVAVRVHQDIAAALRFARIWGSARFDGQQVGPEHRVADGDVVELHH